HSPLLSFVVTFKTKEILVVSVRVEHPQKGRDFIILPCKTKPELPKDTTVEWTHADQVVHVYSNRSDNLKNQDDLYYGRTKMNKDLLRTGDLSLTLKYPTERDSGGYICAIYRDKDILRQKVVLQVKGQTCQSSVFMLYFIFLHRTISILAGVLWWLLDCGSHKLVPEAERVESYKQLIQRAEEKLPGLFLSVRKPPSDSVIDQ
uniref:Ig-like domain-containing protein n=1 Tax=Oreochromis aureus TaxID=47969 RepID=A0AAZ1XP83_OREAU